MQSMHASRCSISFSRDNTARSGYAIESFGSYLGNLSHSTFIGNYASDAMGSNDIGGGTIAAKSVAVLTLKLNTTISHCEFMYVQGAFIFEAFGFDHSSFFHVSCGMLATERTWCVILLSILLYWLISLLSSGRNSSTFLNSRYACHTVLLCLYLKQESCKVSQYAIYSCPPFSRLVNCSL